MLYPLVEDSVLLVEKGMVAATGNIYTGLLEFDDMAFVLHALREDDLFGDIGANIGVYTILAAKNVGAKVIAVEPIPSTFSHLSNNIFLNKITNLVTAHKIGVGSDNAVLGFTNSIDSMNHVVPDYCGEKRDDILEIPVKKMDDLFLASVPVIIKMDIEGFEWPALNGAKKLLLSGKVQAIIIELNGCGNFYGFSDNDLHSMLVSYGYKPYAYNAFERSFSPLEHFGKYNTIYIKNINWAIQRVVNSRKYKILGKLV